ncbi:MAG: 2''-5'' RNA ligase [uncultured archaeon A07HB70]|jgi:2''-5'' RNA ligase|nr:MAG: 2''-5'' RNA ligase [uncultured archaeon A07HB70]
MHDDEMASDASEYWDRRREITPSPERRFVADGDSQLALIVDVSDSPVAEAYGRLRSDLDDFDCVRSTPRAGLHLTVKLFDRTAAEPTQADEPAPTDDIDDAVHDIAAGHGPFEAAFPRLNVFPDTVYAEAETDGVLSALNAALCERTWAATSSRDAGQFVPHLTLGYLTSAEGYDRLVDFLERRRDLSFPTATVDELSLVAYDGASNWRSAATTLRTYSL